MRSALRAILTFSVVLVLALAAIPASAGQSEEAAFLASINQSRSAAGLNPLAGFWDLADDARVHTSEMLAAGQIYHSSNSQLASYATGWALLGENVGMGPNPSLLHQAFMNSPSHRANILGDYDLVGVGAQTDASGTMFVTVVFMKSAAPAPAPTTTTTTTTAPPATTTTPPPTTTTAPPATTTTAPPTPAPPATGPTTTPTTTQSPPIAPATTQPTAAPSTPGAPNATPDLERQVSAVEGSRPAVKASGGVLSREIGRFRPVFGILNSAGSEPILLHTSSGVPVTIE